MLHLIIEVRLFKEQRSSTTNQNPGGEIVKAFEKNAKKLENK